MAGQEKAMMGLVGLAVTGKVLQEITKDTKRKKKKRDFDIGWGDRDIGWGGL